MIALLGALQERLEAEVDGGVGGAELHFTGGCCERSPARRLNTISCWITALRGPGGTTVHLDFSFFFSYNKFMWSCFSVKQRKAGKVRFVWNL